MVTSSNWSTLIGQCTNVSVNTSGNTSSFSSNVCARLHYDLGSGYSLSGYLRSSIIRGYFGRACIYLFCIRTRSDVKIPHVSSQTANNRGHTVLLLVMQLLRISLNFDIVWFLIEIHVIDNLYGYQPVTRACLVLILCNLQCKTLY